MIISRRAKVSADLQGGLPQLGTAVGMPPVNSTTLTLYNVLLRHKQWSSIVRASKLVLTLGPNIRS